jgi:ribokinase
MSARICVVGALHRDLVVRAPRFPQPGETLLGQDFAQFVEGWIKESRLPSNHL